MPIKKQIPPREKLPLELNSSERKLVLEGLRCLDREIEQSVRDTLVGQPVLMSLDDLDVFGGYIAAEANHCADKKKAKKLVAIYEKVQSLLDNFTDEEPPQTFKIEDARQVKVIADQAMHIAEFVAKALAAAELLKIKKKPLEHLELESAQRETLLLVPGISKPLKKKLTTDGAILSIAEVASLMLALAEDLVAGDARQQITQLLIARHLMDQLRAGIEDAALAVVASGTPTAPTPRKPPVSH